ncbi:MAG: hypothetical protein ABUL46_04045, partial [Chitinophaga rupis]
MSSSRHIHYLRRKEIDLQKWDACIGRAPNGLIYGRSFYLDYMTAGQWDALVWEDYTAVMPLTWKRKAGIRYLYQPPFTQQLGLFSQSSTVRIEEFLPWIHRHFRFAEIFLNYENPHPSLQPRTNFILPLDPPYAQLAEEYKKDLVKNLKLASRSSFQYTHDLDLSTALEEYKQQYQHRTPHVKEEAYTRFKKLCFFLQPTGQIVIRTVTDHRQQPLAIALLLRQPAPPGQTSTASQTSPHRPVDRMHLLKSTVLPAGRQTEANH